MLVRPDDDSRGTNAVQEIEGMLDKLEEGVTTEVMRFEPNEFEATTRELVERLDSIDDEVVVNLAGGDRALIIPLMLAAMSTSTEVSSAYVRSDVTHESQEVTLPMLRPTLNDRDREVLNYVLEKRSGEQHAYSLHTDVSNSTVSRSVETLKEIGYVDVEDGKVSNSVRATFPATLVENRL